jgi:hypothetical protein
LTGGNAKERMMASVPPTRPDPRTANDDDEDATPVPPAEPGDGVSSTDPAEGGDGEPGEQPGSPRG